MALKRTHIIALANQKGGCGKTTTTVSLAAAFASLGKSVTIIDTDPQCNATDSFGLDRDTLFKAGHGTLADAFLNKRPARELEYNFGDRFEQRLFVVPGHRGINTVSSRLDAELASALAGGDQSDLDGDDIKNEHRLRLRHSLDSLRGIRDIVLIDTPPELGFLMTTSLIAADWYIIPVFPSGYDLKGLETLIGTTRKVGDRYNPDLDCLGVLMGNSDQRAKLDKDIHRMLKKLFTHYLFDSIIYRGVKHREAPVNSLTIFEHAPAQPPSEQFQILATEILDRLERHDAKREEPRLKEANRG